jgi:predicted Fe-Mo cluster-binding NifX family protein
MDHKNNTMKIAIPTRGTIVDDHFGHCESYTIYSINKNKEIENADLFPAPQGCGCKSNIANVLKQKGVTIMLAGNMGQGAVNLILSAGIEVYRGCSGDIRKLVEDFLNEEISDSGETCKQQHHHIHTHKCHH